MSEFKDLENIGLTNQQIEAVRCPLAPVMVIAGAGSGKTSVMAHRFIYLYSQLKIDPQRILCVSFTNKTVRHLQEKIRSYLEKYYPHLGNTLGGNINVVTFHRLCQNILSDVFERKGMEMSKCISEAKSKSIIKEILFDYENINASHQVFQIIMKLRWLCKQEERDFTEQDLGTIGVRSTDILKEETILSKFPFKDMREIYDRFDAELKGENKFTVDDLILEANKYLKEIDVLSDWSDRYDAIMCDEFQDVDEAQFEILTRLCIRNHSIFCVGDPDQAIYAFRGALPRVFESLKKHFDDLRVNVHIKKLEKNFRSTPEILKVANNLINHNHTEDDFRKELTTENAHGNRVTLDILRNEKNQTYEVVRRIKMLKKRGVRLSDIAVLGRNKSHYMPIKSALLADSIHFDDWTEVFSLIKHQEMQDLISWLNIGFERRNQENFVNCLRRAIFRPKIGIGDKTFVDLVSDAKELGDIMEVIRIKSDSSLKIHKLYALILKVREIADKPTSLRERCWEIARVSGLLDYYSNRTHQSGWDRTDTIQKFLNSSIISNTNNWNTAYKQIQKFLFDENEDRLVMSTIHGSKGHEFDHVFLVSLSDGNLPSNRALSTLKTQEEVDRYIDEERRLMYVACTRAKKGLYLFVDETEDKCSRFVREIMDDLEMANKECELLQ